MASPTWQQRFAILNQVFLKALRPVPSRPELAWAWSELAQTHGRVSVRQARGRDRVEPAALPEAVPGRTRRDAKDAGAIFRFERACD